MAVEPIEDGAGGLIIEEPVIEGLADFEWEAGDFSVAGDHFMVPGSWFLVERPFGFRHFGK